MRTLGCILTLCFSASTLAQGERPEISQTDLSQRVSALETQLNRIENLLASLAPAGNGSVTVEPRAGENIRLDAIEIRLDAIEEKLGQLGQTDNRNQFIPRTPLAAMSVSDDYRQEFFRAANGTFAVRNEMSDWMSVRLNGQRWRFPPGDSSIQIPFGVVQVELVTGGARRTFRQSDWRFVGDEHVLHMTITDRLPRQG